MPAPTWFDERLAIDKSIRAHKLTPKLTVSAAVDWLCDHTKRGNHDPFDLIQRLHGMGLDYTAMPYLNGRSLIYVADPLLLKRSMNDFLSLDKFGLIRCLYTRGSTLAYDAATAPVIQHDLRPYTGKGLADAVSYVLQHRVGDYTVQTVAEGISQHELNVAYASQEKDESEADAAMKYIRECEPEYQANEQALRLLGLIMMDGYLHVRNAKQLLISMPSLRGVPALMTDFYKFSWFFGKPVLDRAPLQLVEKA